MTIAWNMERSGEIIGCICMFVQNSCVESMRRRLLLRKWVINLDKTIVCLGISVRESIGVWIRWTIKYILNWWKHGDQNELECVCLKEIILWSFNQYWSCQMILFVIILMILNEWEWRLFVKRWKWIWQSFLFLFCNEFSTSFILFFIFAVFNYGIRWKIVTLSKLKKVINFIITA